MFIVCSDHRIYNNLIFFCNFYSRWSVEDECLITNLRSIRKLRKPRSNLSNSTMSNIQQQSKSLQNNVINDGNANNMATNNNNNTSNSCDNQQTTPKALEDTLVNGNDASTTNGNYQQRHLEDWLNATMKASPKTFSVSSAEFLDGASRNALNTNGLGASYAAPPLNLFRMNPTQVGFLSPSSPIIFITFLINFVKNCDIPFLGWTKSIFVCE